MSKIEHGLRVLIVIVLLSGVGLNVSLVVHAQGSPASPDTFILIDSNFKLWNDFEKALDKTFTVYIWMPLANNSSVNKYIIRIDNIYANGSFSNHYNQTFSMSNVSMISILEVMVNNQTKLLATNIRIMTGITQSQIDQGAKPFMISLLPSEWSKKEWNIFFSIITSAIFCSFISYRLVVRYRKAKGITEIR